MDIGPGELVVALAIIMLLFGPSQLPRTARAIGQSLTELRRGMSGAPESPASSRSATQPDEVDQ
jgi:TatA/E family protein of Tat protein translocase